MEKFTPCNMLTPLLIQNQPAAHAWINGNAANPQLYGLVSFYEAAAGGVVVCAELHGLPAQSDSATGFYGMHIHEKGNCTLPFDQTGEHYNPTNRPHPYHAGDLPSLLGNKGYAWMCFYTSRFTIQDILNKSLVIHAMRDDFTSQPAGDSGTKIGCGVIYPVTGMR